MDMKYHIETAWAYCIANLVSLIILTLVMAAVSIVSFGILAPVAFATLFLLSVYQNHT